MAVRKSMPSRYLAMRKWPVSLCAILLWVAARAGEVANISAPEEYADFVRAIAVSTALAKINVEGGVKVMTLKKWDDGQIRVRIVGVLPNGAHGPFSDAPDTEHAAAIVHVHHDAMEQAPGKEDALTVRHYGIPNFVIGFDGQHIWEVGVVGGVDVFREIRTKGVGEWVPVK